MRKQQLMELKVGDKVISKKDNTVKTVTAINEKIELDNKAFSQSTMIRWYDLYVQPVDLVEPQDTATTANTDTTATSDLQDTDTQDDQLHDDNDKTTKTHTTEGDTATTSDKITKDDIIYIIEHSNCDAVVKKQYIGAYREDYKGAVCMVRTTRKGNTHIDMKQGIYNSLAESTRNRLEANYNAKVYDSTRGYIRLFEVDDLAVLQDLILAALKIA